MIRFRTAALAIPVVVLASLTWTAGAAPLSWAVNPEGSRILFDYRRNGQSAEGRFTRFTGHGLFDKAAPAAAELELRIQSGSIDLDDALASAFASSAEWFDAASHPEVIYKLRRLIPEGQDRYRADGEITIRGKTRPISTTITLDIGSGSARAAGTLDVNRTDFLLGVGPSALFVDIGPEVSVRFELTARPAR